jgi:glycine cleavage system aminomethyltransferase T
VDRQREQVVQRQLVMLVMEDGDDRDTVLLGGEPLERDGQLVGYVGSAAYAYGLQGSAGLLWLTCKEGQRIDAGWLEQRGVDWAVTVSGVRRSVRLSLRPDALHA